MPLSTLPQLLQQFRLTRLALVVDEAVAPARSMIFASAKNLDHETLNKIISISGSQVYVTLSKSRASSFELMTMSERMPEKMFQSTLPLLQSVEAREGIHTGISVSDRLVTIGILADEQINPRKLVKPGHIFPVQVNEGGVLVKAELFEAVSDLVRMSDNSEVAVVSDLINDSGEYFTLEELRNLGLPIFTLKDLVIYRLGTEKLVNKVSEAEIVLASGTKFKFQAYRSELDNCEHLALSLGDS